MCGIIGCVSSEGWREADRRKAFAIQSIYADAIRGWDSTGLMAMENGNVDVYKRALTAADFLPLRQPSRMFDNLDKYQYFVGHNSAATRGGVYDHTAHPFEFENVVGVHNGTLNNHRTLPGGAKFNVDSEAIFNALNDHSPEEIIPKLDGPFALIWMDKRTQLFHMVRNEERPLSLAWVKNQNTVLIASEMNMLRWLCERNFFKIEKYEDVKAGEIITLDALDMQTFNQPARKEVALKEKYVAPKYPAAGKKSMVGASKTSTKRKNMAAILTSIDKKIGDPINFVMASWEIYPGSAAQDPEKQVGSVEGWVEHMPWLTIYCHGVSGGKWVDEWKTGKADYLIEGDIVNAFAANAYEDSVVVRNTKILNKKYECDSHSFKDAKEDKDAVNGNIDPGYIEGESTEVKEYKGPGGEIITREMFAKLTEEGCVHCQGPIYFYEADEIMWDEYGNPLCTDCIKQLGYKEFN